MPLCVATVCVGETRPQFFKSWRGGHTLSKVGRFGVFGSDCGYFGACVGHEFSGVAIGGRYRLLIFTYVWMGSYTGTDGGQMAI